MPDVREFEARNDDDIQFDPRRYIDILLRRRRLVMAVTLVATLLGLLISITTPRFYEATAKVAIVKAKPEFAFGSNVETVSDEDLAVAGARQVLDATARRTAYEGLVNNATIATNVIAQLGDQLTESQRNPSRLMNQISGQIVDEGDLINISVTDRDPERAAAIANAWAGEYEELVNTLYSGAPTTLSNEVGTELKRAKEQNDTAQAALETFIQNNQLDELTRLIGEKKLILDQLQLGKTEAISTTIREQLGAQQQIINAYYNAQSANKLLVFNKQQEAKRTMLSAYIDAEVQNRLAAFNRDRNIRRKTFESYVTAEISGTQAVINEQVSEKTATLSRYYAEKTSIARLLDNARAMRDQINDGGNAAAESNALALLLLKSQAFTPNEQLPANLQLQVGEQTATTAAAQIADLDAIVSVLEERQVAVEQNVQELSRELLAGTGYNFLNEISTAPLAVGATPGVSATQSLSNSLATNIDQRYRALFEVGPMATEAQNVSANSPLFQEIKKLYPDLFTVDQFMELTEALPQDTALSKAADERARELLNLNGLEDLPSFSVASEKLAKATDTLQNEIRELEVQRERERIKQSALTQERDLAGQVYDTLLRKQTELGIATAITGSEVRVAGPAAPPVSPSGSRSVILVTSAILGFLVGVVATFLVQFLYGNGAPQMHIGKLPSAIWNRGLRWVLTPTSGLPTANPGDRALSS